MAMSPPHSSMTMQNSGDYQQVCYRDLGGGSDWVCGIQPRANQRDNSSNIEGDKGLVNAGGNVVEVTANCCTIC